MKNQINKKSLLFIMLTIIVLAVIACLLVVFLMPKDTPTVENPPKDPPVIEKPVEPPVDKPVDPPVEKPVDPPAPPIKLATNEIKDVTLVEYYKNINGSQTKVTQINPTDNLADYTVLLSCAHLPSAVCKIDKIENGKMFLTSKETVNGLTSFAIEEKLVPDKTLFTFEENIVTTPNYTVTNKIAYNNLNRLAPALSNEQIIQFANTITIAELKNKTIENILNYVNDTCVFNLDMEGKKITKIKIIFTDETSTDLSVKLDREVNGLPYYTIADTSLPYIIATANLTNTRQYITNKIKNTTLDNLLEQIGGRSIDKKTYKYFEDYLDSDYYLLDDAYKKIQENAEVVASKFITHLYSHQNDAIAGKIIEQQIDAEFNKYLLTYTYFYKWYGFEIGGVTIADELFFKYSARNESVATKLTDNFFKSENADRKSNYTGSYFFDSIAPIIKNNSEVFKNSNTVNEFIEKYINVLLNRTDYNVWLKEYFKGVIVEATTQKLNGITYQAWDLLKSEYDAFHYKSSLFLPLLATNCDDLYIMCVPSQICFGTATNYPNYDKQNTTAFRENLQNFANKMAQFYDSSFGYVNEQGKETLKTFGLQIDSYYEGNSQTYNDWISPPSSNLPSKKDFFQAIRIKSKLKEGVDAYTTKPVVKYVSAQLIDNVKVFTHETTHMQFSYFFNGGVPRTNSSNESYATGMYEQDINGEGTLGLNLLEEKSFGKDFSVNFSPSSIDTPQKIQNYYHNYFEALYTLDLLEFYAIKALNDYSLQSELLSFQTELLAEDSHYTGLWQKLSSKTTPVALNSFNDLIDNNLNINRDPALIGDKNIQDVIYNEYDKTTFLTSFFTTPLSSKGFSDWFSYKRFPFELLGMYGYENGFCKFLTQLVKYDNSDIFAMKQITGDQNFDAKVWQKAKYKTVDDKLINMQIYGMDKTNIIEIYKNAFDLDAKDIKSKNV
ncbi:MAG: ZmpA/ZmpB/ZmpC family metallo-endopeptidase, partial [Clostridia bacterium]